VIKVDDLNFTYRGGAAPVIQDVEFRMTLQSRCALLGKNGAGKTTVRPQLDLVFRPPAICHFSPDSKRHVG